MSFLDLGVYDLVDALEACQEHGLTHEQIFIYTRMGKTKKALQLIIDELIDIDEAIRYCLMQYDVVYCRLLIELISSFL